jgi:predicted DNA-binding protein YlxM (UPF0122 family)
MIMLSSIDKIFNEDIREKRKTSRGVYSRTGKRGYVGKMKFPSDIMHSKDRRKYRGNGKVVVWNMYEDIMEYSYFKGLPQQEQKKVLEGLRKKHTNKEIQTQWGLAAQSFYNLVTKLGAKKREMGNIPENTKLDEKVLTEYTKEVIPYNLFKTLIMEQKQYLFDFYLTEMTTQELAKAWKISVSNIYNFKSRLKKQMESGKLLPLKIELNQPTETENEDKENVEVSPQESSANPVVSPEISSTNPVIPSEKIEDEQVTLQNDQSTSPLSEPIDNVTQADSQQEKIPARNYGTTLSFEGEYTKEELKKKLLTMVELLEDDDRRYKMNVSFTEIS